VKLAEPGETFPATLTLESRDTGKFARARMVDEGGSPLTAWLSAAELGTFPGRHLTTFTAPATAGQYTIFWEVYDDAGHTTLSDRNRPSEEAVTVVKIGSIPLDVWKVLRSETFGDGSMGNALKLLMGSMGKANLRIDKMTYDANGFLQSAKMRVFPDEPTATASTARAALDNSLEGALFEIDLSGVADGTHLTLPSTMLGVLTTP
jgi:hypothetical protein